MRTVDHLVIAGGDLSRLIDWFRATTGAEPQPGGVHPGMGTRNALVGLGERTYLELIAPDPDQPDPDGPRPFAIDLLGPDDHRLTAWAAAVGDIDAALAAVPDHVDLGPARAMSRTRPDGTQLSWRLTTPPAGSDGSVLPFLIDWGQGSHPTDGLPPGCALHQFTLVTPDPEAARAVLRALDSNGPAGAVAAAPADGPEVASGPEPRLLATIRCPAGEVALEGSAG